MSYLPEDKNLLNKMDKTLQKIKKDLDKKEKDKSKWTPAMARAYGLRIDQKIKTLGRSGLSKLSVEDKLDSIIKMLMGVSSGNLMNLAVSKQGGLLAKAALAKGLVTESEFPEFICMTVKHLDEIENPVMSFKQYSLIEQLHEKLFDGDFNKKSYQHEALEFLQTVKKMVDGRRINTEEMTLRNNVYCLIQRPMTVTGSGYLIVKVIDDGSSKINDMETEITINPRMESFGVLSEVISIVVKNYSAPKSFNEGAKVRISPADVHAISEDNKRFYLTFTPNPSQKMNHGNDADDVEDAIDEFSDDVNDVNKSIKKLSKSIKKEAYLFEKTLSNSEIQDLIDSIKQKLKGRNDTKAKGMLKLTKDIETTFKDRKSLHPNSVVTVMRLASSLSGKWGKNAKDWTGSPPSGRLNKYPPSPTQYAS